jgi:hypothetical protein
LRAQDHPAQEAEEADAAPALAYDVPDAPGEESIAPVDAPDDALDAPREAAPVPAAADEHDSDVIALTPVHAHNAQAGL